MVENLNELADAARQHETTQETQRPPFYFFGIGACALILRVISAMVFFAALGLFYVGFMSLHGVNGANEVQSVGQRVGTPDALNDSFAHIGSTFAFVVGAILLTISSTLCLFAYIGLAVRHIAINSFKCSGIHDIRYFLP